MDSQIEMPHHKTQRMASTPPLRIVYPGRRKIIKKKKWRNRPEFQTPPKIQNLDDLLNVAWNYQGSEFDWFKLWSMIPVLTELKNIIGMDELKQEITDMVMYHILNLHDSGSEDILHTVLYGKPGVGKSMVAGILAKIYCRMGFLSSEKVVSVKRSDLLGKYIGYTEEKTSDILKSALGGVLFIDEAYSMGHGDKTDSFAKSAVDLLNQFLTEHSSECICIIAGYEKDLDDCFFSINKGLNSRFPVRFHLADYTSSELEQMFRNKISSSKWSLAPGALDKEFFSTNIEFFPAFGRDIASFFMFCKKSHARRVFVMEKSQRKTLTREDLCSGMENFARDKKKKNLGDLPHSVRNMYS